MAAAAILDFEMAKFYWLLRWRRSRRISVPNFVKIGQSVAKILRFFDFQDGGCLGHNWTTNSEYLGVSITVQNLVMIDVLVFII